MRIVSTLPLFTAAPLVTTQAFQVQGEIFENQDTVHTEETFRVDAVVMGSW